MSRSIWPRSSILAAFALALLATSCETLRGNAAPTLDVASDHRTTLGEPLDIPITVTDEAPDTVVLTASADDTTLIPDGNLDILGTGATRTLRVTPDPTQLGTTTITLTARDEQGEDTTTTLDLLVDPPDNTAPTLDVASDHRTTLGEPLDIPITVTDEAPDTVVLTASADDTTLIPDGNLDILGTGATRTLRVTPDPTQLGTTTITLTARDEQGEDTTTTLDLLVDPPYRGDPAKLTASDGAERDSFGRSVAIDGSHALIGASRDDNDGNSSGSAYLFEHTDTGWTQIENLTASDAAAGDNFGRSVAIDGNYALIGAAGTADDPDASGSAYLFEHTDTGWTQTQKLTANDAATGDAFGWSVAIDGTYALIGAYGDDDDGDASGSAYLFRRTDTGWTQTQKLTANDAAASDAFGWSVAIDGNDALIGAIFGDADADDVGGAYVFERSDTGWTQTQKLNANDAALGAFFGFSVAIDANHALIGANDDFDNGTRTGSAYIYQRTDTGWTELQKLTASDAASDDDFGQSVAIDGTYALIGASGDDDNGDDSGSAYIYPR